jgi:DNA-binding CsgD family transcriptional regulator
VLGHDAAQIASEQHVSIATVRSHLQHTLAKLGVSSQVAAVALVAHSCRDQRLLRWARLLHQF